MLPLQQPFGHDVASQTQAPVFVSHFCPVPHVAHAAPAGPQDPKDSEPNASQVPLVPPLQQPFGHVPALHAQIPLVVSQRPLLHEPHAAPPLPHPDADCEA